MTADLTAPDPAEALAEVLMSAVLAPGPVRLSRNEALVLTSSEARRAAAVVLAAIDSGQVPGVGRVGAVREHAYLEGYEAGLLAPQSAWMRARAGELAKAWDEGRRAGADMGLGISERIVGSRDDWPTVPANPYEGDE